MFDLRNSVLLTFTLLTHFLPAAQAAVSLHYFPQASCNANTDISGYTSVAAALLDTSCHVAPDGTVALYVDGVDEGCTVRTYNDATCASVMGLSITVGTCYFSSAANTFILSWKVICGSGAGGEGTATGESATTAMPDAQGNITSTVSISTASSGSTVTGTESMPFTGHASASTTVVVETAAVPTTHVVNGQTITESASATHTCNGNCTWTSQGKLTATQSKAPGYQGGTGSENAADMVQLKGWRKYVLKALMAMAGAEALWAVV